MATKIEKKLQAFLDNREAHLQTPGLKLRVYLKGRKKLDLNYGKVYSLYDVASLTKVAFTLEAFVQAWQQKKWSLSSRVGDFLPWVSVALPSGAGGGLKVEQLLCHSSGLPAWRPFYRSLLKCSQDSFSYRWTFLSSLLRKELMKIKPPPPRPLYPPHTAHTAHTASSAYPAYPYPAVYSDVGFLLLGFVLEALYQRPLWGVWDDVKQVHLKHLKRRSLQSLQSLQQEGLHFCPQGNHGNQEKSLNPSYLYAPTRRCPWQKKTLQGEVDDENARALGGIAPHAGLFGSMEDVSRLGLLWRERFLREASSLAPFFRRRKGMDWSLGWMFPSSQGASCGDFLSPLAFGHTAFTGPSLWYDPPKDLLILILSHRVYLSRDGEGYRGASGKKNNKDNKGNKDNKSKKDNKGKKVSKVNKGNKDIAHQRAYFKLRASLHNEIVKALELV